MKNIFEKKPIITYILVGIVIGWLLNNLSIDKKALVKYPLPFLFSNQENTTGTVIAHGSWRIVGEEAVNKYNSAEIRCHGPWTYLSEEAAKKLGVSKYENTVCDIIQADVFNGLLTIDKTSFDVTDWTTEKIISSSSGVCVSTTMIVDKVAETVTQTSSYISSDTEFCMPKGTPPKQIILK